MSSPATGLASLLLLATTAFAAPFDLVARDGQTIEWGAIGDSWASGVFTGPSDAYKTGDNPCLLTNYAYAAQLAKDNSWTSGNSQDFHFAACSGARLVDMAAGGGGQVRNTGNPYVVTMTAGGNNAGFARVAVNCIYQQVPTDNYGPAYPDPASECTKAINDANAYIHGQEGGLEYDMKRTLIDLVNSVNAKSRDPFYLYLTGYGRFFAVQDGDGNDWCSTETFGVIPLVHAPKLTKPLRKAINQLTLDINALYSKVVGEVPTNPGQTVRFIDIDSAFDGHRFCEQPTGWQQLYWHSAQYYGDYVWFWNLSPPQLDGANPATTTVQMPPANGLTYGGFGIASNGGLDTQGSALRPFHPKPNGYTGIKNIIMDQLKKDIHGGSKATSAPKCNTPKAGVNPSVDDAEKMQDALAAAGDDKQCVSGNNQCANLQMTCVNNVCADLCYNKQNTDSIGCGLTSDYFASLIQSCTQNGMVAGSVDIPGHDGLSLQI